MANTYYVYGLKDPRRQPASFFYIGKGTGNRAAEHFQQVDQTHKGRLIREILDSGTTPIVTKIVANLSEEQALQIELALIGALGTKETGGSLYNTVIPKTIKRKIDNKIVVPVGAVEKAQLGLQLMKESINLLAEENPEGITNSDCAHYLGLQSDNQGKQQDYLTYSILGLLLKDGVLESKTVGNRRKYRKI